MTSSYYAMQQQKVRNINGSTCWSSGGVCSGIRLSACVLIFIAGWVAGGIFTFFYFGFNDPRFKDVFLLSGTDRSVDMKTHSHMNPVASTATQDIVEYTQTIPWAVANDSATAGDNIVKNVFVDWPSDQKSFGYFNYKSFESILAIYPNAKVSVFAAPAMIMSTMSTSSSRRSSISSTGLLRTHLLKYQREQLDINAITYDEKLPGQILNMGHKYRAKWGSKYTAQHGSSSSSSRSSSSRAINGKYSGSNRTSPSSDAASSSSSSSSSTSPPFHWLFFWRLANLWLRGGIYSDLSYILLGELNSPLVHMGYHLSSYCSDEDKALPRSVSSTVTVTAEALPESRMRRDRSILLRRDRDSRESITSSHSYDNSEDTNCKTSTLLVFNRPKSDVILCILGKYDEEEFQHCLVTDQYHSGANCVEHALMQCFETEGVNNDLSGKPAASHYGILHSHKQQQRHDEKEDRHALRQHIIESFADNPFHARTSLLYSDSWRLHTHTRIVWVGPLSGGEEGGGTTSWYDVPYANYSLMHHIVLRIDERYNAAHKHSSSVDAKRVGLSALSASASSSSRLRGSSSISNSNKDVAVSSSANIQCSRYFSNYEFDWERNYGRNHSVHKSLHLLNSPQAATAAPFLTADHDFDAESKNHQTDGVFGSKESSKLLMGSTGFETLACSPSIVIVSFDQSTARVLAQALSQHPLLLPSLLSASIDSDSSDNHEPPDAMPATGSCYSDTLGAAHHRLSSRMWCFPFISPHEATCGTESAVGKGFVSFDDTDIALEAYKRDYDLPFTLKRDNPNMKLLFVVKNPVVKLVENLEKYYATMVKSGGLIGEGFDANAFLLQATEKNGKFGELRQLVQQESYSSSEDSKRLAIRNYYTQPLKLASPPAAYSETADSHEQIASAALSVNGSADVLQRIFEDSLYVFPMSHFAYSLGTGSIKVVAEEELYDRRDASKQVNASFVRTIYDFLGLCPVSEVASTGVRLSANSRTTNAITDDNGIFPSRTTTSGNLSSIAALPKISRDVFIKLSRFFEPFNTLIDSVVTTGFNAEVLRRVEPEYLDGLPLHSTSTLGGGRYTNETSSGAKEKETTGKETLLWFEEEEKMIEKTNKLVPQRTTTEDSRFNTTLGMLNTF